MCHRLNPQDLNPDRLSGYLDYLESGPLGVAIPPENVKDRHAYELGARDAEAEAGVVESYASPEPELVSVWPGKGYRHRPRRRDQDPDPEDTWDEEEGWE